MASSNLVVFLGNWTCDPQLSYTPKQTAVADVSLAMNEKWKDSGGVAHEDVCFIDVRAFGKLAEIVNKHTKKGSCVQIVGRLKFERWEKDGQTHSKHRVIAERVTFLSPSSSSGRGQGGPVPDEDIPF